MRFQSLDGLDKVHQKPSYNDKVRLAGAETIAKANKEIEARK